MSCKLQICFSKKVIIKLIYNMNHYFRFFYVCTLLIICTVQVQAQKRHPSYESYINKYKDLAIQQQLQYKIPASITLAQGLLETGAGSSRLAIEGNNHFGIKCKDEWTGGRMYHDDDEKNECFRTYKSAEDSYIDHSLFLAYRKYYTALFDLDIYDYKGWAHGLQKAGYATDKQYGTKLIGLIETYELHIYDKAKLSVISNIEDDIYEIKINAPASIKGLPNITNWRRRIFIINDIHYITAQKDDTYDIIAYDTRMKLKRLYKYNEVTKDIILKEGDFVFLQNKKKYASKGHITHTVSGGDSMHSISQQYGMKLKKLYKLNNLKNDYIPKTGDILRIRK